MRLGGCRREGALPLVHIHTGREGALRLLRIEEGREHLYMEGSSGWHQEVMSSWRCGRGAGGAPRRAGSAACTASGATCGCPRRSLRKRALVKGEGEGEGEGEGGGEGGGEGESESGSGSGSGSGSTASAWQPWGWLSSKLRVSSFEVSSFEVSSSSGVRNGCSSISRRRCGIIDCH